VLDLGGERGGVGAGREEGLERVGHRPRMGRDRRQGNFHDGPGRHDA